MKKHYFHEEEHIEKEEQENIEIALDDYMNHPPTKDIIMNQHFFDFEENIGEKIKTLYRKHAYIMSDDHYLNDNDMINDDAFMNFIYNHIIKDYDNDFLKENPLLENTFFKNMYQNTDENQIKVEKTKIIKSNNKKFDWATKSYK